MKSLKNHVQLIGNTGKDVELKTFESGSKKASVSFATTDYYKNAKGELVSQTQWHNLVAWGRNAEFLSKAVQKGDQLVVKGSINYRNYEDKSGISRHYTEILVDEFLRTTKNEEVKKTSKKKEEALPF